MTVGGLCPPVRVLCTGVSTEGVRRGGKDRAERRSNGRERMITKWRQELQHLKKLENSLENYKSYDSAWAQRIKGSWESKKVRTEYGKVEEGNAGRVMTVGLTKGGADSVTLPSLTSWVSGTTEVLLLLYYAVPGISPR